jgi:8-oxo-dGTP pyrophosphatase MutT (NUDIX family)
LETWTWRIRVHAIASRGKALSSRAGSIDLSTSTNDGLPEGYEPQTAHGAKVRADVVDVYVFTRVASDDPRETAHHRSKRDVDVNRGDESRGASAVHFLQLLRSGAPLDDTWQPVMGHVHAGETSVQCARREMAEELGLRASDRAILGFWALEQVHPFYIAAIDTIVMSPRFCIEVQSDWTPKLNDEHRDHRWVRHSDVDREFMWPGQRSCCHEIMRDIVPEGSLSRERLRLAHGGLG